MMRSLIHPTAIIDPQARIDPTVRIGAYSVIEGPVTIGPDCGIASQVKLIGPLEMGRGNSVHSLAVLGDAPQDLKYHDQPSRLIIGENNIFREHVTVHRGTGGDTIIGSNGFFMVGSHIGHNCRVGDGVTLVNSAVLGGHVQVFDRAIIGGLCAVHQFCRVGRLAMISNNSAHNVDIPPFCIAMDINMVTQLNAVGLRRSGIARDNINAIRQMFKILFRDNRGLSLNKNITLLPPDLQAVPEVREFTDFVVNSKRGIARFKPWSERQSRQMDPAPAED
ncbi:MAG: acyl-ACP--UDP-N-acetylglucosamine O-acyltransferase [Phycisphaerae bacterium]